MPGRVVVQFDKNDVEDLGLIKMDMLGLRTLSVVAETLELAERSTGIRPDLDTLPLDDQRVYEVRSRARPTRLPGSGSTSRASITAGC